MESGTVDQERVDGFLRKEYEAGEKQQPQGFGNARDPFEIIELHDDSDEALRMGDRELGRWEEPHAEGKTVCKFFYRT